jgi:phage-related protein
MARGLKTRARPKPTQRRAKSSRPASRVTGVKAPGAPRAEFAIDPHYAAKLSRQDKAGIPAALVDKSAQRGRGKDAMQIALLLQMQQTHGNRAVQRILNRNAPAATALVDQANQSVRDSSGNAAVRSTPLSPVSNVPEDRALHRFSLSDLNPIAAAKKLAESAWGAIKSLGSSAWDTAKDLGSSAWNAAKDAGSAAWGGIQDAGSQIWGTVKNLGAEAWNTAENLGSRAWNFVRQSGSQAWSWAKQKGSQVWSAAKNLGGQAWNWAKNFGGNIWNSAKSLGSRLWGTAKSWGSRAWGTVKNGVGKAWDGIKALGGRAWQAVKGAANKAWQTAKDLGSKAWALAKSAVGKLSLEKICAAIGAFISKAYQTIAPYVEKAWADVKKLGAEAWDFAKKWGGKLWDNVKSWVGKIEDLAKSALSKAVAEVKNLAGRAWTTAKNLGNKLLDGAKRLGSKAWDFAKRMGTQAWDRAKTLAGKLWDSAKNLGAKAIDTAKRLGEAVWEKAKALGAGIYERAKDAAGKLLGLADKLTGGLASKVAGLAKGILDRATGLLSWVLGKARDLANRALETAKSWASKALETAKTWAGKLWDAAKNTASKAWDAAKTLAGKAWDKAKSWAGKAWDAAKTWGAKAISTAEAWAHKAWDTAKSWAGKAWDTAKSWAGKAWDATKSWAGKAWDTVKEYSGKVWSVAKSLGSQAWDYAKQIGAKAADVAKALGLDKAWNWVKEEGSKALTYVKEKAKALGARLAPILEKAKKVTEVIAKVAVIVNPATWPLAATWAACKAAGCAYRGLFTKGSTAQKATDITTDLTPVVSTVKDGCGCLTGENMITGEEIGGGERAVRCSVAAIDIASYVGAFFTEGGTAVGEQAAKGAIRAWLERLLKIGGKELAEKGEEAIIKQFAKMSEKELAEALSKMGEKELKELAEQASKNGEKDLEKKVQEKLAERAGKDAAIAEAEDQIRHAVCGFCFPAGTKVLGPQGYANIEDLVPGDFVLARDENGLRPPAYRRVLQVFQNVTDSLLEITIGNQQIKTTPGHVWWISGRGWILAKDVAVGDLVATSSNELAAVTAIRQLAEFAVTYNCEVEEYRTYFVSAGEGQPGIWVHNASVGVRVLRPDQVFQLIIPEIVITSREAIRQVIGNALQASGSYSTELKGLYSFLRQGGGAGFQGVTGEAIDRLEVVLKNIETKGGGVVAAMDLERIGARRVFDLTDPEVVNMLMKDYPRYYKMFGRMTAEGVVAVRGKIPALAVQSLVNIPPGLSAAGKRAILEELAKPCKR